MDAAQDLVDPTLRKLSQYLGKLTRAVVEIYLGAIFAVAGVWLILMGSLPVLTAVVIPVQDFRAPVYSVVMLPVGAAWIAVLWTIVLTLALQPFINPQRAHSLLVQVLLAAIYLLHPLVATTIAVKLRK